MVSCLHRPFTSVGALLEGAILYAALMFSVSLFDRLSPTFSTLSIKIPGRDPGHGIRIEHASSSFVHRPLQRMQSYRAESRGFNPQPSALLSQLRFCIQYFVLLV